MLGKLSCLWGGRNLLSFMVMGLSEWLGWTAYHLGRSSPATRRWLRSRPTSTGTRIFVLMFRRRECPNLINVTKATCANPSNICRRKKTDSLRASYSLSLAITTNQASPREIKTCLLWMIYYHTTQRNTPEDRRFQWRLSLEDQEVK
jgi:hypothetical protein